MTQTQHPDQNNDILACCLKIQSIQPKYLYSAFPGYLAQSAVWTFLTLNITHVSSSRICDLCGVRRSEQDNLVRRTLVPTLNNDCRYIGANPLRDL
jgi:hypothetical protein